MLVRGFRTRVALEDEAGLYATPYDRLRWAHLADPNRYSSDAARRMARHLMANCPPGGMHQAVEVTEADGDRAPKNEGAAQSLPESPRASETCDEAQAELLRRVDAIVGPILDAISANVADFLRPRQDDED